MNLSAIGANLGFKGCLGTKVINGEKVRVCRDEGCPEDGIYYVPIKDQPEEDMFMPSSREDIEQEDDGPRPGYHYDWTYDNRRIEVPDYKG